LWGFHALRDVTRNKTIEYGVLKGHGIVEREDNGYSLVGYEDLGDEISPANAKLPSPTSVLFPPSTTGSLQLTGVA